jgi:hypothetical protein
MRIVEAERELIQDLLGETRVTVSKAFTQYTIHAGQHETLGKVVIVEQADGRGVIVETDE